MVKWTVKAQPLNEVLREAVGGSWVLRQMESICSSVENLMGKDLLKAYALRLSSGTSPVCQSSGSRLFHGLESVLFLSTSLKARMREMIPAFRWIPD